MNQPVVVHAIRGYVSQTETFVGNQVSKLQNYKPVVVCHHRSENREFDIDAMYVVNEQRTGIQKAFGAAAYNIAKTLTASEIQSAAEWITALKPALIHFHYAVDAAFFAPLYKRLRLPAVVSLYGYDVSSFPGMFGGLGKQYLKRAFDSMDCFLAMSEDMKRNAIAIGAPEKKILVHYHGINTKRFSFEARSYQKKKMFNILCVGTLEKKKGQHHLIRALAGIRSSRPDIDARLTLVGNGPTLDLCRKLVDESGLQDSVEFAGYVPHLDPWFVQYYRDADVFVHFSTTQPDFDKEGIPGTIVEAMASGLPVIATRHAGIPEIITNGVEGILLEESDTDGIVSSLISLHENEDRRQALGQAAARRSLNTLNVETRMKDLEQIYDRIADAASSLRRGENSDTHEHIIQRAQSFV